jgi:hypothetical protein
MKSPKLWEPKVYEDSRLPVWFSGTVRLVLVGGINYISKWSPGL